MQHRQLHFCIFLGVAVTLVWGKFESVDPPVELVQCFDEKRFHTNASNPLWDCVHGWCIQKYRWHLTKHMWHNISSETELWVEELLRMTEHDRAKRQTNGNQQPSRLRQEYRRLTDTQRYNYHRAIQLLKADTSVAPNRFDALANLHQRLGDDIHHGAAFLGWHRVLLIIFENALRQKIPSVVLPYWDSRIDQRLVNPSQSIMWTPEFVGTGFGRIVTGPFRYWQTPTGPLMRNLGQEGALFSEQETRAIFGRTRLEQISEPHSIPPFDFEIRHGNVHKWVGGHMAPAEHSAFDPLFYLHHAFVDFMWELFRIHQRRNGVDPTTDYPVNYGPASHAPTARMGFGRLQHIHGLSDVYTSRIYTYENTPTCSYSLPNCGTPYIQCQLRGNTPQCVSATAYSNRNQRRTQRLTHRQRQNVSARRRNFSHLPANFLSRSRSKRSVYSKFDSRRNQLQIIRNVDTCPVKEPPHVMQNLFEMNGISDTRVWVYVPIMVVYKRNPQIQKFNSFAIHSGNCKEDKDLYDPRQYSSLKRHFPKDGDSYMCPRGMDGTYTKIMINSDGLNYHGTYREYALLDARQPFSSSIAYLAVKSPEKQITEVLLTATDECGNVCKAYCKNDIGDYEPCSGAVKVTSSAPKLYGHDYGDAVRLAWNLDGDFPCINKEKFFIKFLCS